MGLEGREVDIVCPNFGEIFGTVSCKIPTDKFVLDEVGNHRNSQAWGVLIIDQTLVGACRGLSQGSALSCLTSSLGVWVMGLGVTPAPQITPNWEGWVMQGPQQAGNLLKISKGKGKVLHLRRNSPMHQDVLGLPRDQPEKDLGVLVGTRSRKVSWWESMNIN